MEQIEFVFSVRMFHKAYLSRFLYSITQKNKGEKGSYEK